MFQVKRHRDEESKRVFWAMDIYDEVRKGVKSFAKDNKVEKFAVVAEVLEERVEG